MPTTTEDQEVRVLCEKLLALLYDPHPGLFTWVEMRNNAARNLYNKLKKLGVDQA